jgi:hypothetical protein
MLAEFKNWLDSPFTSGMSATRWLAFVGLVLAAILFWSVILKHMGDL